MIVEKNKKEMVECEKSEIIREQFGEQCKIVG
jgi:hypothetical protein